MLFVIYGLIVFIVFSYFSERIYEMATRYLLPPSHLTPPTRSPRLDTEQKWHELPLNGERIFPSSS